MENEVIDEKIPAEGGEPSTPETEPSDETTEEPTIPHTRVKEMVSKAEVKGREEALRELMDKPEVSEPAPETSEKEEAITLLRKAVRDEVMPLFTRQQVETFLDKNPEALNYVDKIKNLRSENPNLTWDQALKLASYDDKVKTQEAKEAAAKQQSIEKKKAAVTEKPKAGVPPKEKPLSEMSSAEIEKELEKKFTRS